MCLSQEVVAIATPRHSTALDLKAEFLEIHAHCTKRWTQERKTELRSESPTPTQEAQIQALRLRSSALQAERDAVEARYSALLTEGAERRRRRCAQRAWLRRALRRALRRRALLHWARANTLREAEACAENAGALLVACSPLKPAEECTQAATDASDANTATGALASSSLPKRRDWSPGLVAGLVAAVAVTAALRQRKAA